MDKKAIQDMKERGECAGCPGSLMCWGGEQLTGRDCVICGKMFVGCDSDNNAFESLGEIKTACSQLVWSKYVCDSCSPAYKETIVEKMHALLKEYETAEVAKA